MLQKQIFDQITVIVLGINDLEQCLALDLITFNGIWTKQHWQKELIHPKRICLGIIKNKKLIAFTCGSLILDEVNITLIGVHPSYQRLGLGKILIKSLLEYACNHGVKTAKLEVKETNIVANLFYKNLEFKNAGFRPRLYKDGSNAIILKKTF